MDNLQSLLTTYAYNILGSYEEAKDVVQDVLLDRLNNNGCAIHNEKAYLTRSVINKAINTKNRQKRMLSEYPGKWLPQPILTDSADYNLHQEDILSYSLMVLLENLDARQRAVFILKEAFDYDHEEIARVLDISVENSRKILSRAKKELRTLTAGGPSSVPADYLDKYIHVIRNGDIAGLERLLSDDVVLVSDGGGKAVAALHPVVGKTKALSFLSGIYRKFYQDIRIEKAVANHHPALLFYVDGQLVTCQIFVLHNEKVHRGYFMRNPDKLDCIAEKYAGRLKSFLTF